MRLDHRRSGVAHTRPHPAGCPGTGPAVAVSIYVRPVRAAETLQSPAASCRLGSRCEPPHGRRHPCRRPSVPDGNGLCCKMRHWRSISHATPPLAPAAQSSAGQSSRGRRPRERWCLRVTRAGMDAGGLAKPLRPGWAAHDQATHAGTSTGEPAGLPAGLSGVGPARVEPQEAATPQQNLKPRTQPQALHKTSRMDAAPAPPPPEPPTRVREPPPPKTASPGRDRMATCPPAAPYPPRSIAAPTPRWPDPGRWCSI